MQLFLTERTPTRRAGGGCCASSHELCELACDESERNAQGQRPTRSCGECVEYGTEGTKRRMRAEHGLHPAACKCVGMTQQLLGSCQEATAMAACSCIMNRWFHRCWVCTGSCVEAAGQLQRVCEKSRRSYAAKSEMVSDYGFDFKFARKTPAIFREFLVCFVK